MPLKLNNVEDIYAHSLFLLNSNGTNYDEVRDLINAGGGGGSGIISSVSLPLSITSGNLSINLLNYITSSTLSNTLAGYTDTTGLNNILANYTDTAGINTLLSYYTDNTGLTNLLSTKQNTLTSGTGISISNNIISGLELQLDGITQNATTLNFLQNNALLSGGVLNVSRLSSYDKIPLIYSNAASIKDLKQDVNGHLTWDGSKLALTSETFTQINHVPPLSGSVNGTVLTLESLFKPSTITFSNGFTSISSDTLGTLAISLSIDSPLFFDSSSRLTCDLSSKQDTLTASTGIVLNAGTISVDFSNYTTTADLTNSLNGKVDDFQVLTNVPSGAVFTDTVYSKPANEPISYITGLQAEVSKLNNVVVGSSGLSLGTGTGTPQRFAIYEASGSAFFYGMALFEGMNNSMGVGVGIYGGTNSNIPDQYGNGGAGTTLPHMLITRDGRVGIMNRNPAEVLDILGNFKCVGNLDVSGSGKGNGVFSGTCTAQSFPTSSDKSIKDNITKANHTEIQNIFNSIDVKTYVRNDGVEGSRIGFIANEFDSSISQDSKFKNIVHKIYKPNQTTETTQTGAGAGEVEDEVEVEEKENYILGLDYSRICCLLWGVCKNQELKLQQQERRLKALEKIINK